MKIIIGLGNPSMKYTGTRHNVGFGVIDVLAEKYYIKVNTNRHRALCGSGMIGGEKVILAKPLTYMNLSGESVRALTDYYKLNKEDLLILYDDVSLELGQIRIRAQGSAGGHNGMKSIISHLGSDVFARIRLGIGARPDQMELADYVLGHFTPAELPEVREELKLAGEAVEVVLAFGIQEAMNRYNGLKRRERHGSDV